MGLIKIKPVRSVNECFVGSLFVCPQSFYVLTIYSFLDAMLWFLLVEFPRTLVDHE
jgi:hypothetical protein